MADPINLRLARKRKARAEKDAQATENRRVFGMSKVERAARDAAQVKASRHLDGHRLHDADGEPGDG